MPRHRGFMRPHVALLLVALLLAALSASSSAPKMKKNTGYDDAQREALWSEVPWISALAANIFDDTMDGIQDRVQVDDMQSGGEAQAGMEENTMGDEEDERKLRAKVLREIFALEKSEREKVEELLLDDDDYVRLMEDADAYVANIDAGALNRPVPRT